MRSVVFIDRIGIYYYGGNVHSVIFLPFTPKSVSDLEVINETELSNQIVTWLKANAVEPTETGIVFSSVSVFQKEIPADTTPDKLESLKKEYIDNVPFNEVLVRDFMVSNVHYLTVINKPLAYVIKTIFHTAGFTVESISTAGVIYGNQQINSIDNTTAQDIINKSSVLRQETFLVNEVVLDTTPGTALPDELPAGEHSNKRLYLLLGAFGFCVIALGAVYFLMGRPAKPAPAHIVNQAQSIQTTTPPSPTPTMEPTASESASLAKENISIKVLNGSGVPGQADGIKSKLEEKGFKEIKTGNASLVESARTLIIFKPKVGEKERKEVINVVEFYSEDTTVQQQTDIDVDILITTAKQTKQP